MVDFSCTSNSLTELNLKNGNNNKINKTQLNLTSNPSLSCIKVDNPSYSTANWYAVSKDVTATYNLECVQYTIIPDVNFENKLIALGLDSGTADGQVLTSKISSVTSLDISRSSISNVTGIEDFTALTSLTANNNQIVTINLSKNTKLTSLNVSNNLLTSLDISANTLLEDLNSMKNKLTSLNVSNNTKLTSLVCADNQLTSIDVSSNTLLTGLTINTNKITSLNVEKICF